jgi:hypothetical protein
MNGLTPLNSKRVIGKTRLMDGGPLFDAVLGQRRTATDLAFTRLRRAIIDGELMPDERLT